MAAKEDDFTGAFADEMLAMMERVEFEDSSVSLKDIMKRRSRAHPPELYITIVPPPAAEGGPPPEIIAIPVNKDWVDDEYHSLKNDLMEMFKAGALVSCPISHVAHPITSSNIGYGTYGVVHRATLAISAEDAAAGKAPAVVAVKKYRVSVRNADGDSDALKEEELDTYLGMDTPMFHELANLKEATALHRLNHPNIIRMHKLVWDTVTDTEIPRLYLVMEYAPGNTLGSKLANNSKFLSHEPSQIEAARQLANAISYMHSHGFIHRDLTPFNVLVGHHNVLKVADFGFCTNDPPESGRPRNILVQNILSRAPEIVLRYRNYTSAIDIWSMGVIFYLIFMRRHLFALTIRDDEHSLLRMMIMHFGRIEVEWLNFIRPACVAGAIHAFEGTILAASEELMHVHIMNHRMGQPMQLETTIVTPTLSVSSNISLLFRAMMQYNHTLRPSALNMIAVFNNIYVQGGKDQINE
jgi:serine/threonine protein kinase